MSNEDIATCHSLEELFTPEDLTLFPSSVSLLLLCRNLMETVENLESLFTYKIIEYPELEGTHEDH